MSKKTVTKPFTKKAISVETDSAGNLKDKDLVYGTPEESLDMSSSEEDRVIEKELNVVPEKEDKVASRVNTSNKKEVTKEAENAAEVPDFMNVMRETSKELVLSNRTHFELLFSDLGFATPDGRFDPLVLLPYETRDLELEGFSRDDLRKSKNLRNFIASAKVKFGGLDKEGDKLPETTIYNSVFRNGDVQGPVSIPFQGEYFVKWSEFVKKENDRYTKSKLD